MNDVRFQSVYRLRSTVKEGLEAFVSGMCLILNGKFDEAQRCLFFLGWTPSDVPRRR